MQAIGSPVPSASSGAVPNAAGARIASKRSNSAANAAFNVTNGDVFRWRNVWPALARHFDMAVGDIRPVRLEAFMADKDAVWQQAVRRHGLQPSHLADVAAWAFGDFVFGLDHDIATSTARLRATGFRECVDSEAMFVGQLDAYRAARILP